MDSKMTTLVPRVTIADEMLDAFPELNVVSFVAENVQRFQDASPVIGDAIKSWKDRNLNPEDIGQLEQLLPWRQAFARQGVKPSQFRSSVEALIRRFASGKYQALGLPVVDLYNAVSAQFQVPFGAYDLAKMGGENVVLRFAAPGDRFEPLGGGEAGNYPLTSSIPIYAQGPNILCWCFNHRDSRRTAVTAETEAVIFISESITGQQAASQALGIERLRSLLLAAGASLSPVVRSQRGESAKIAMQ
jgi:lysyl-tRNA synthetase class 2